MFVRIYLSHFAEMLKRILVELDMIDIPTIYALIVSVSCGASGCRGTITWCDYY